VAGLRRRVVAAEATPALAFQGSFRNTGPGYGAVARDSRIAYGSVVVAVLGGVIGGVLGFVIVMVIAEWQFVDWFGRHDALEGVLLAVLVGGGAFAGSRVMPRISRRAH